MLSRRHLNILSCLLLFVCIGCDPLHVMPPPSKPAPANNDKTPANTDTGLPVSPDPEVSHTVVSALEAISDPRINVDVVTFAGIFGAMSEVVANDTELTNTQQIFKMHDNMREGVGMDAGRYKTFSELAGGYLKQRLGDKPVQLTPELRRTAANTYRAIYVGCLEAAIKKKAVTQY